MWRNNRKIMKTLAERIKDLPEGTKLYSPCYGEVTFVKTTDNGITCRDAGGWEQGFFANGSIHNYGECMLFPSNDNRSWDKVLADRDKFDVRTLQPFDKVLVRDCHDEEWQIDFFGFYNSKNMSEPFSCTGTSWYQCVPYNEDTKYLLGSLEKAPDYYKTWKR